MVMDIIRPHRLKGTSAHMQCHKGNLRALFGNIGQQLLIKMQTSRRRRHRTQLIAINRLVATLIFLSIRAINIGRQMAYGQSDPAHLAQAQLNRKLKQIIHPTQHLSTVAIIKNS